MNSNQRLRAQFAFVGDSLHDGHIRRNLWSLTPVLSITVDKFEGSIRLPDGSELVTGRGAPSFSIGVVIERRYRTLVGGIRQPMWSLGELAIRGQSVGSSDSRIVRQKTLIEQSEDCERFLWTGLVLSFFKDGGESYWHSLVGEQQQIFVVCQEDEDDGLCPILVTADYDEAMAYQEADDTIFSSPMPAVIYQTLERFVLENYAPEQKKRRKRKQWHSDADEPFAKKPRA